MGRPIAADELRRFCREVFVAAGAPLPVAAAVADSLVYADLRGVESHGVVRTEIYLKRVKAGMVDPHAAPRLAVDAGSALLLDGANNFGAYVGLRATEAVLARAAERGVAAIGVHSSNHFGTAAYYIEQAVERGFALLALSNASQTMPATGGKRPFIGTNPFAIGFPTRRPAPFLLDMATSVVARGKIIVAAKKGESIPLGWAIDKEGVPTTDAQAALEGSVLPLGGAKGSGLAMAVDILCGVLTGAGFGPSIHNMYDDWKRTQNVGHFFVAFDISKFLPLENFLDRIETFIVELKDEPKAAGVEEILYAGELEHRRAAAGQKNGLVLPDALIADLQRIGKELSVRWVDITTPVEETP